MPGDLAAGTVVQGRYRVERRLGEGGMATAYLAWDTLDESYVALKLLRATRPELAGMLRAEFAQLRGLEHPNLARVRDFGLMREGDAARPFYAADPIVGSSLAAWAVRKPVDAVLDRVADALEALAFLHELGIAHGDFKQDNVLVDDDGRAVLVDLGCARRIGTRFAETASGTPGFIAPELIAGGEGSRRSDLFAVGVTLTQLLARRKIPERTRKLLARLTADEPARRPADVGEVLEALGRTAPRVSAPGGRASELVGRERIVARFAVLLDRLVASEDAKRVLLLHGPDGIGRSRLLQELKWMAQLRVTVTEGTPRSSIGRMLDAQPGLESMLSAIEQAREPRVLVLDDAHLLPAPEAARLAALTRALSERAPILLVCAARDAGCVEGPAVESIAIEPLDRASLSKWTAGRLSARGLSDLMRATGGLPAYVEAVLARMVPERAGSRSTTAGRRGQKPRKSSGPALRMVEITKAAWQRLTEDEREALSLLAIHEDERDAADVHTMARLQGLGWVVRGARGWRLARAADAPIVHDILSIENRTRLHLLVASDPLASAPSVIEHLARGGRLDAAGARLVEARGLFEYAPAAWARAVAARAPDPGVRLIAADALQLAGQAGEALAIVARVVRKRPAAAISCIAHRVAGAAYLRLGRLARAERQLRRASDLAANEEDRALVHDLLSRTLLQRGQYSEARAIAEAAGRLTKSQTLAAALEEDVGIAAAYLGEIDVARRCLARALTLHGVSTPRASVRIASYTALAEFRAGHFVEAAAGYRRALAIAEEHGLDDQHASALSNLGTVQQQLGEWGPALESYERAIALASALGKRSTEVSLRFNLANLYAGAGCPERASALLSHLSTAATEAGSALPTGAADLLAGEMALEGGELDAAATAFTRARDVFVSLSADRDRLEAELGLAQIALARGLASEAESLAQGIADRAREPDLHARAMLLVARAVGGARALGLLEDALATARTSGQRDLTAEIHAAFADAARANGADALASEHTRRARVEWERIAATMPMHLRAAFWAHGMRAKLALPETDHVARSEGAQLRRILEINTRLGEARSTDRIVEAALDAAIELSGAERGFVLLREDDSLRERDASLNVVAARNLDRERIGRSHLKFSRGIAERVVETGEPVMTTDAQADDRFLANESVHAMRLRSVACVPIRGSETAMGAIYVDHRFEASRFERTDVSLLLAFADQVAIALRNARLTAALEERTRQLEAEKQRVEAHVREQAREIDRLAAQAVLHKEALSYRYDYASIVGRSAAMRAVLGVLERVIDSSLNLLIQGESGTGKELVARCVHFNGPRREGPFVAINCAAMPETLLESELFGYQKGAFTGADRDRDGLFVRARGGTLFLDELGETSAAMQAKLLRVLQDKIVRPLGANEDRSVDFRLVCATNRDLRHEIERGRFREDLYFRVAVVEVSLPPLRDRIEDIPGLAEALLERLAREHQRDVPRVSARALTALAKHPWPGNVRELENVLGRALVMCQDDVIDTRDLGLGAPRPTKPATRAEFENQERDAIHRALEAARWNVSDACRAIGMPRTTFYRKLARYGLLR